MQNSSGESETFSLSEERRLRRVSKDCREIGASWFETREAALLTMRVCTYLYESGSGESDGLANSFFNSGPIGTLRFSPFGGIFCVNHLS